MFPLQRHDTVFLSLFYDKETEAQRGQASSLKSHSLYEAEAGIEVGFAQVGVRSTKACGLIEV